MPEALVSTIAFSILIEHVRALSRGAKTSKSLSHFVNLERKRRHKYVDDGRQSNLDSEYEEYRYILINNRLLMIIL